MSTTPTVHNPTNFEPRDYEVQDYLDNRRPAFYGGMSADEYRQELDDWTAHMTRTLGPDFRAKSGRCIHCGNGNVRWITAVRYAPTGEVVVFGSDCTDRLGFANAHAFKLAQLKARADARQVRFAIWHKREKFLVSNPDIAIALKDIALPIHARNSFAADVLRKLDQYGELTSKQTAAVLASMERDRTFAARKAAEQSEVKGAAPSGRVEVTGEVLTVKQQESAYGYGGETVWKLLIKLTNNSKVWVTRPSGGSDIERGDTVTVKATWTVSDTDQAFAFGKRPTLLNVTRATAQQVTV